MIESPQALPLESPFRNLLFPTNLVSHLLPCPACASLSNRPAHQISYHVFNSLILHSNFENTDHRKHLLFIFKPSPPECLTKSRSSIYVLRHTHKKCEWENTLDRGINCVWRKKGQPCHIRHRFALRPKILNIHHSKQYFKSFQSRVDYC